MNVRKWKEKETESWTENLIFVEKIVLFNNIENVSRLQRTFDLVESVMMTKSEQEPSHKSCENRSNSIDLLD